ncbi:uncharacterized protein LOC143296490 [Babylonia areolata]|uniref:uncharacterized protein LOC143296490 n=1 Tax=Babylonia areolata TaxID=304850 RepID=UPI003FD6717C
MWTNMNHLSVTVLVVMAMGVNDVMSQTSASCDVNSMPTVDKDFEPHLQGNWYLQLSTPTVPFFQNLTSLNIYSHIFYEQGQKMVVMRESKTYLGSEECCEIELRCKLTGSTCDYVGRNQKFTVIIHETSRDGVDVLATWWEIEVGGQMYNVLNVFSRVSFLTNFRLSPSASTALEQFCGTNATDPASGFYELVLSYANLPACFS